MALPSQSNHAALQPSFWHLLVFSFEGTGWQFCFYVAKKSRASPVIDQILYAIPQFISLFTCSLPIVSNVHCASWFAIRMSVPPKEVTMSTMSTLRPWQAHSRNCSGRRRNRAVASVWLFYKRNEFASELMAGQLGSRNSFTHTLHTWIWEALERDL